MKSGLAMVYHPRSIPRLLCFLALLLVGTVARILANRGDLELVDNPEGSYESKNTSAMWLYTPKRKHGEEGQDHKQDRRKRNHIEEGVLSDQVTLCWPNAPLRECKEVTISWDLYAFLNEHHVADMKECFCATEGFDTFESETKQPLFIDGTVFNNAPLHLVAKYTGDPLPDMDITFLDSSSDDYQHSGGDARATDVVCWPNPLLGECKEAEITHTELSNLLMDGNGDDLDFESCSCASEGFSRTKQQSAGGGKAVGPSSGVAEEEGNAGGVETFSTNPRVTLCYFDTQAHHTRGGMWWDTGGGIQVQKTEICKQVTIDRDAYDSSKSHIKKQFNDVGIFECIGGCNELGYSVRTESIRHKTLNMPFLSNGEDSGGKKKKKKTKKKRKIYLIRNWRSRETSPGEWVYTYIATSHVTLCHFEGGGHTGSGVHWWRTNEGGMVRKRELCTQFTVSRELYISSTIAPERQERFNECGIYECGEGGCAQLGYHVLVRTREQNQLKLRDDKPPEAGGYDFEQRSGKFQLSSCSCQ